MGGNVNGDGMTFSKIFNPYMPMKNFMNSFKTLAARNPNSFLDAVKNVCKVIRKGDALMIACKDLLNKYATSLTIEAKQSGIWESQDPRTTQWKKYNDNDMVCIESAYQEFVRAFIDGKCENFGELSASVDVNIEGLKFTIDIRENRQKNSSGGSRT